MVDSIRIGTLNRPAPAGTYGGEQPAGGQDFAVLLQNLAQPQPDAGAEALPLPAAPAPRPNLTQALHYLTVRSRTRATALPAATWQSRAAAPITGEAAFRSNEARAGNLWFSSLQRQTVAAPSAGVQPAGGLGRLSAWFAAPAAGLAPAGPAGQPWKLADYPRPAGDNGRGVHWIPTTCQTPEVVDKFVDRLQALGMRWVTFLNQPGDLSSNEYLVRRLTDAGIMPVMRIYTDGGAAITEDIQPLVRHYRNLGVSYFQLYNEPNLKDENQGRAPDVNAYLDRWIPAARQVIAAGGLPGLGALSPQGDADDSDFLRRTLAGLQARGAGNLLDRAWVSVHNYGQDYLRVRQYNDVIRASLGRSLPLIGTEAGIYPDGKFSAADQVRVVSDALGYLPQREPYYFAYSLWVLANQAGGGHDGRWEYQALYRQDGPSELARALERQV